MADGQATRAEAAGQGDLLDRVIATMAAVTGGLTLNSVSADLGHRGAALATGVLGALLAYRWLRRRPRAPIVGITFWGAVGVLGMTCVVGEAVTPGIQQFAAILAVSLVILATLVNSFRGFGATQLVGIGLVGLGASVLGLGIAFVMSLDTVTWGALDRAEATYFDSSVIFLVFGLGLLLGTATWRRRLLRAFWVLISGCGVVAAVEALRIADPRPPYAPTIVLGLVVLSSGLASLHRDRRAQAIGAIVFGAVLIPGAVAILLDGLTLQRVAVTDLGLALVGLGCAELDLMSRARQVAERLAVLTLEPPTDPGVLDPPSPPMDPGAGPPSSGPSGSSPADPHLTDPPP